MKIVKLFLALFFPGVTVGLAGKEATWTGDPWEPVSRDRVMEIADEMIDVLWTPPNTMRNFRTPNSSRIVFNKGVTYRGIAYSMIDEVDDREGFLWKVATTAGGETDLGNDCSGFVSIAWRLPVRLDTQGFEKEMMEDGAILVRPLGPIGSAGSVELFRGDAVNKRADHNFLIDRLTASGIVSAEQTPGVRNTALPHKEMRRHWAFSSITGYRPMRRNLIEGEQDAPSERFQEGEWVQTTPGSLNRRGGPGTAYNILGSLPEGSYARILPHQNNGVWIGPQTWWFVEVYPGGERGWLAGSYLRPAVSVPSGVVPAPVVSLDIAVSGEGKVVRIPDQLNYVKGTKVELRAVGAPGWGLHAWEGELSGNLNPVVLEMDGGKELVADFRRTFEAWTESEFSFAERKQPEVISPTADPFGTGIQNLAAYLFGLDVREPDLSQLPRMERDGEDPVFVFRRKREVADVVLEPEISEDLLDWTILGAEGVRWEILDDPDPAMEIVRVTVPVEFVRGFLRLRLLPVAE